MNKGQGPTKIRFNLSKKGIGKEEIKLKLERISPSQWMESAHIVISKKKKELDQLDKFKLKQKIYQLLTRQGHSYQTVKAIIDAYPHLE
jgi:SOS response regulatory protein OraA/RecX